MTSPRFITNNSNSDNNTEYLSVTKCDFLKLYDTFLLDCDGVLWLGNNIIPGIPETLDMLRNEGKKLIFVTNNSTKSRAEYVCKFTKLGIQVQLDEIFSSAYAAAIYLKKIVKLPPQQKVFVIGMNGIHKELSEVGIEHFSNEETAPLTEDIDLLKYVPDEQVGAVLVGLDRNISYRKYAQAFQYLKYNNSGTGCTFLATNDDSTFPMSGTMFPGTGAVLAPLITSLNRQPKVMGKPSLNMLEAITAIHQFDPTRTCMIGDRLNTDIEFGLNGQLGTLLVLTGVTQLSDLTASKVQPHFIIPSLAHLRSE